MKAIVQSVNKAYVTVDDSIINTIGKGLCVFIGITKDDTIEDLNKMVKKLLNVRIFSGENNKKWQTNVKDNNYEILCISQFTLCSQFKGNKLTFHRAMETENSKLFYQKFLEELKKSYSSDKIKDGQFGAMMEVFIQNNGPVTISIDTRQADEN